MRAPPTPSARLAAVVGVPAAALTGVPVRWEDWTAIDTLSAAVPGQWRTEALVGRPQIIGALREYDLAQIHLEGEVAKRWPQLRITPAYTWGAEGVHQDPLDQFAGESALGVSFELPLFNQHQGAIGEALGRRTAAGEHLKAVQAQIYEQIDRAELAWPSVQQSWAETRNVASVADEQQQAQQRALRAGASDRTEVLAAQIVTAEARLTVLESAYAAQVAFGALEDALPATAAGRGKPDAARRGGATHMRGSAPLPLWVLLLAAASVAAAAADPAPARARPRARPARPLRPRASDDDETPAPKAAAARCASRPRASATRTKRRSRAASSHSRRHSRKPWASRSQRRCPLTSAPEVEAYGLVLDPVALLTDGDRIEGTRAAAAAATADTTRLQNLYRDGAQASLKALQASRGPIHRGECTGAGGADDVPRAVGAACEPRPRRAPCAGGVP